ncbi:hypothetical protein GCM10028786_14770 [Flaviaesturariibacter terrae]
MLGSSFPDYSLEDSAIADLNADGTADALAVLQSNFSCDSITGLHDTHCRMAVILTGMKNGAYRVAASNTNLLDCTTCGGGGVGDPYRGIVINGNFCSFEQLFGDCDKTQVIVTFRYDPRKQDWVLHKVGRNDYNCREDGKSTSEVRTVRDFGQVRFQDYQ